MPADANPPLGKKPDEEKKQGGIGGMGPDEDTALTILSGKKTEWFFDPDTGMWYIAYVLPATGRRYVFEATPKQMKALFGKGKRPRDYETISFKKLMARDDVTFGGDIAEMEGEGSIEKEIERVLAMARDEGTLPDWAKNNAKAQEMLYLSVAEEKSTEWLLNQWSTLSAFKQRYAGLENFTALGLDLIDALSAYHQYEMGLKEIVKGAGLDPETVTPLRIKQLTTQGHSLDVVAQSVSIWKRMRAHAPALKAFNNILMSQGKQGMNGKAMYKFLKGEAPADVYDIYEAASLREAATQFGLKDLFSAQDAMRVALQTPGMATLESASEAMRNAADLLLRMRHEVDVQKFGITHEELIDMSLGVAPRTGRSEAEIQEAVNRAMQSAAAWISRSRSQPYRGFSDTGTPQARSLGSLRQSY